MGNFWKFFASLFTIGLINNFSYVLIGVGAQAIAEHFGQQNLMPLFTLMLVACGTPMLIINFRYLVTVNTLLRISAICIAMTVSFAAMSLCISTDGSWGFPVSLIATLVMGLSQSVGECVNLGYLKVFPADYLVGFSSGTGFAGIAGTGAWLICKALGLENYQIFLVFMPLLLIYWITFFWVYKQGKKFKNIQQFSMIEGNLVDEESYNSHEYPEKLEKKTETEKISNTGNAFFSPELLRSVWKSVRFWGLNLFAVYFLEYSITTGFADRATLKISDKDNFFKEYAFAIIQFCYQLGVWFSRSSLKLFKVEKTWIVTVLQLINWVVWWFEAEFLFLTIWGEFILTIWVGCMGGLAYVNTGYLILNSETIPKEHKEAALNISLCLNNLGVLLACCFCLILDNFIMKN